MYSHLLVPTDGSKQAEAAADRAIRLAKEFDATLSVLAVIESGPLGSIKLPGQDRSPETSLTDAAESFVDTIVSRAIDQEIAASATIRQGLPVSEICGYAEEESVDLIVMGSRGSGGFDRMLLGSVAEGVSRYGEVDVLLVEANGMDEEATSNGF